MRAGYLRSRGMYLARLALAGSLVLVSCSSQRSALGPDDVRMGDSAYFDAGFTDRRGKRSVGFTTDTGATGIYKIPEAEPPRPAEPAPPAEPKAESDEDSDLDGLSSSERELVERIGCGLEQYGRAVEGLTRAFRNTYELEMRVTLNRAVARLGSVVDDSLSVSETRTKSYLVDVNRRLEELSSEAMKELEEKEKDAEREIRAAIDATEEEGKRRLDAEILKVRRAAQDYRDRLELEEKNILDSLRGGKK